MYVVRETIKVNNRYPTKFEQNQIYCTLSPKGEILYAIFLCARTCILNIDLIIDSNHIQRIIFWWQYCLQASNINSNCEHIQTYRFLYIDDMASTCTGI